MCEYSIVVDVSVGKVMFGALFGEKEIKCGQYVISQSQH